ncbi:hypothetical protein [Faecalicoccus pleomorphus]|uniref:hypothetical protein n=1 Tax=Faecalicoccus pleomorphus TaxID=1323 RepID=UPI002943810C|nr:hypothetical protein [Faecalicoccus pleomorphus]
MKDNKKIEHRWIDDSIEIDFKIPSWWEEEFKMLEKLDREYNPLYLVIAGDMEDSMHEDILSGDLTKAQAKTLCLKYNGPKVYQWEADLNEDS